VDGKVVASQVLELRAGARRDVALEYAFPRAGAFRVKLGDAPEKEMMVPGGIGLALQEPLIYLTFDQTNNSGVKDEISGAVLPVVGTPQFASGKEGLAFRTGDKKTFVKVGNLDLYRKPFTLAAWVNIESLENRQATFFGGAAPMGADIDVVGTSLAGSVFDENLLLTFRNRDARGHKAIPTGKWIHVAYTYNSQLEQGAVYLNGVLDQKQSQKPYAGPLEMIGSAPELYHGKFMMDDVLVTRSCMAPEAVRELAQNGVDSLQHGQITTEWRSSQGPLTLLQTWAEVPANASIEATVESGDQEGNVIASQTVALKSGAQSIALNKLKLGVQVRLRVRVNSLKWGALPLLRGAILSGGGKFLRWSTTAEWNKGAASGGLKIGL
jgi:hypothetical protein